MNPRRPQSGRRLRRLAAAAGLAVGLGALVVGLQTASMPIHIDYDRPGVLVSLPDGRRLDLRCTGRGRPTVILEAGFGADSAAWGRVQSRLATETRVCSYDRAGYGFSDVGPPPRDGEAIARDLDRALHTARINGPFVLVGHSAGGLYVRLLASRRPKDVLGLVFVDPSVEFQDRRYAAVLGPGAGSVEGIRQRVMRCAAVMEARPEIVADREACVPGGGATNRQKQLALRPATWRAQQSEIETLFTTTSEQAERTLPVLRSLRAVVLTASPDGRPADAHDPGALAWQAMHRDLARAFDGGEHWIVRSSHMMMVERPDVVTAAIERIISDRPGPPSNKPLEDAYPDIVGLANRP